MSSETYATRAVGDTTITTSVVGTDYIDVKVPYDTETVASATVEGETVDAELDVANHVVRLWAAADTLAVVHGDRIALAITRTVDFTRDVA